VAKPDGLNIGAFNGNQILGVANVLKEAIGLPMRLVTG
jgi:hypothetical protein